MKRSKTSTAPGQPGKPTVDDDTLSANRDALVDCLSSYWPDVGWQLTHATTRGDILRALEPLREHPARHRLAALIRPTSVSADAEEIRKKREALGEAISRLRDARAKHDRLRDMLQQAESAMTQAKPQQVEAVEAELSQRRADWQQAKGELESAGLAEKMLQEELADSEAAFAQDEILMFIGKRFIKGTYARNPLNLAHAMAGLPYSSAIPFLGAWQSYARCSKLRCVNWPHFQFQVFETILSIWRRSQRSAAPTIEFFRHEIGELPKLISAKGPEGAVSSADQERLENYLRRHLVENWAYLRQAIERSMESLVEENRMPFLIASEFAKIQAAPKKDIDLVLAGMERIEK